MKQAFVSTKLIISPTKKNVFVTNCYTNTTSSIYNHALSSYYRKHFHNKKNSEHKKNIHLPYIYTYLPYTRTSRGKK